MLCNLTLRPSMAKCTQPGVIMWGTDLHTHVRCYEHEDERGCCTTLPVTRIAPPRLMWDEYFMSIARAVASRASCSRASVGCVIVDSSNRIVATGYNGAPAGQPHCNHEKLDDFSVQKESLFTPDSFCTHTDLRYDERAKRWTCAKAHHAERNAITYLSEIPQVEGELTLYTTHSPCVECAELIAQIAFPPHLDKSVFKRIVYSHAYNMTNTTKLLLEGIELVSL